MLRSLPDAEEEVEVASLPLVRRVAVEVVDDRVDGRIEVVAEVDTDRADGRFVACAQTDGVGEVVEVAGAEGIGAGLPVAAATLAQVCWLGW